MGVQATMAEGWKRLVAAPGPAALAYVCNVLLVLPLAAAMQAVLAASMDPVGLAITSLRGVELPTMSVALWAFLPNYVCAVLAVMASRIFTRLVPQTLSVPSPCTGHFRRRTHLRHLATQALA